MMPLVAAATLLSGPDWLVDPIATKARVSRQGNTITLGNGIIQRKFVLGENAATIRLDHLRTGEAFLRAVKPEAEVVIDGVTYPVGGLTGQPNLAFLRPDWIPGLKAIPNSFTFTGYQTGTTEKWLDWKRVRHNEDRPWPAPGASLTLTFEGPANSGAKDVVVQVRYELYDGSPILSKKIRVINDGPKAIRLDRFTTEILGVVEADSYVEASDQWPLPNLSVLSEYAFGGGNNSVHARTINWTPDPEYKTQVNYELKTPCLLRVAPPIGPDQIIEPGKSFDGFRSFMLLHDSSDRERKGLETRRFYRMMAPWVTENPLMLHLTSTDPKRALPAIDQAAECGFEMVILSFGSGVNMEDASPANIARFKELHDYAAKKGLELGGYSLLASRSINPENDVINPKTGKTGGTIFGNSPCLCSAWGQRYFQYLEIFINKTSFDLLEHDGNYPGDICASTTHPGHRGTEDSQWNQWVAIRDFYYRCRARGTYLNVPDWYYLAGSNKSGMGYRETNWSLPRAQQHIHARQNLFDGTWQKAPSMGWMFTPLVEYQGGGAAATIEPLKDHLADYEQHLYNNLGYGAQSCYRGFRLYDAPETKAMVVRAVEWFKKHRAILESDVIHLRRPDGERLDFVLHVNPKLETKGMLLVYNPTDQELTETLTVPLYYTGLRGSAKVAQNDGVSRTIKLSTDHAAQIKVKVPPMGRVWVTFR